MKNKLYSEFTYTLLVNSITSHNVSPHTIIKPLAKHLSAAFSAAVLSLRVNTYSIRSLCCFETLVHEVLRCCSEPAASALHTAIAVRSEQTGHYCGKGLANRDAINHQPSEMS